MRGFYDPATSTWSYLVGTAGGRIVAVVDPVLDYDPRSGKLSSGSAQRLLDAAAARDTRIDWILETHAHADHLSAARWLKNQLGGRPRIGIGRGVTQVQETFKKLLHLDERFVVDGSQFDHLFQDGETFAVGELQMRVMATPGHTPDSITYLAGDAAFIGDTLFMPDYGTARCDFPGGDARQLYRSISHLLSLPADTRLFLCHDYAPATREPQCQSSPPAQRAGNVHLRAGSSEDAFVAMRQARDAGLASPVLLWPSIQVNIRAGSLPEPETGDQRFLKIPLRGVQV